MFDLAQGQPLDRAVALVAKAVQMRRTTVRNLRWALGQRPNQSHHTRCDNDYESGRVKVEVDGRLGHAGWANQQRDGRRERRNAGASWLTVRVYWSDVAVTPCDTALELEAEFRGRGWAGRARPCRRRDRSVRRRVEG